MDEFFCNQDFLKIEGQVNSCGAIWPIRKDEHHDFGPKNLKLKGGDIRVKTREGLTGLVRKDG